MTNPIELTQRQREQVVLDELDFLIGYEIKHEDPDTELLSALRLVRGQFEIIDFKNIGELHA